FQMILPKEQQVKAHCETIEEIVEGYKEAWIMGGSLRKAENILEQYNFIIESLEYIHEFSNKIKKKELRPIIDNYKELKTMLQKVFVG
ncbi:MAG: hypothetical protein AB8B53_14995, partial [Flavobacteriales bacterium]